MPNLKITLRHADKSIPPDCTPEGIYIALLDKAPARASHRIDYEWYNFKGKVFQWRPNSISTETLNTDDNTVVSPCPSSISSSSTSCSLTTLSSSSTNKTTTKKRKGVWWCVHGFRRDHCTTICRPKLRRRCTAHNRILAYCRECGGTQICIHGKRRTMCSQCGGGSLCKHNRIRSACHKCHIEISTMMIPSSSTSSSIPTTTTALSSIVAEAASSNHNNNNESDCPIEQTSEEFSDAEEEETASSIDNNLENMDIDNEEEEEEEIKENDVDTEQVCERLKQAILKSIERYNSQPKIE